MFRPGNEVQCDQTYLSGLLLELNTIKTIIIGNPRAFGLCEAEAFEEPTQPIVLQVSKDLVMLSEEVNRLRSHPELFSDERTRKDFFQQSDMVTKQTQNIPNGHIDDMDELVRRSMHASGVKAELTVAAPHQPWQSWCGPLSLRPTVQPPQFKDFKANHPDMVLVGAQIVPHMGVLIAEHWREKAERIVTAIIELGRDPETVDAFPKVEKMIWGTKTAANGRTAVLKIPMLQPTRSPPGHVFAFGPQRKIADLARFLARCRPNLDITKQGHPKAVMIGIFLNREEAKKYPHLSKLE